VEWDQPDVHDASLIADIEARHANQPRPITYTFINPNMDMSIPENKRKCFGNLHRQLGREVEKAVECGSYMGLDSAVWREVGEHAGRTIESWDDMEMDLFEPRVRELVKLLIQKRREIMVV
jgi:hypothetical protein